MLDVALVGPLNVDLLITGQAPVDQNELTRWAGPSQVMLCAAGSAGYIAQDLAKFGLNTGILSVLADDPFGDGILRILNETGLDTSQVSRQKGTLSGIGIYMLLFGSKKRPLTYRLPTHQPWPAPFTPSQREYLLSARHLHCAGYLHFPDMWNDEMAGLFRDAKERGHSTSLDPQFPLFPIQTPWMEPLVGMLPYTDILMVDEDEAHHIARTSDLAEAAHILQVAGPHTVVIKQGAKGALLCHGSETIFQPAEAVPEEEIVESIGAGDAFDTGLIYGFLKEWSLPLTARFATLAAASTLRGSGGTQSLAPVAELERLATP